MMVFKAKSMRTGILMIVLLFFAACNRDKRKQYLNGLYSCRVDSICISSFYFGEGRDKSVVKELLTGLADPRITHHLNYKGMSAYYCKAVALNKISGLRLKINSSSPDTVIISKFMNWAIDNRIITSREEINILSCTHGN
jgi:hypothetical protein